MKTHTATIDIPRSIWDAIQASFDVDFRCVDENDNPLSYDQMDPDFHHLDVQAMSDAIRKHDLRCGTCPYSCAFEFDDGVTVGFDWFVEEFGGVVRWADLDSLDESWFELEEDTIFDATPPDSDEITDKYICHFNIID